MADIGNFPSLSHEEEVALTHRIQTGDDTARNLLVKANLRFVMSIAKQYRGRGLAFEDLVSEGNMGLLKAARRFDAEHGVRFISYAVWWIRQTILLAIAQYSRTIKRPGNSESKSQAQLKPSGMPKRSENNGSPESYSCQNTSWPDTQVVSLEQPVLSSNIRLIDTIKNDDAQQPDAGVLDAARKKAISKLLATIEPRAAKILCLYFGLKGYRPHNLEEISRRLGIPKHRVRLIKERVLLNMRRRQSRLQ
jgi:RNA polymerase primary sigma factor